MKTHVHTALSAISPLIVSVMLVGCDHKPQGSAPKTNPSTPPASPQITAGQPVVPSSELSDTPGAPMIINKVVEQSQDTPLLVPGIEPAVTDVPIPNQVIGLQFQGGQSEAGVDVNPLESKVFGSRGSANKIVYLVDASGSMVDLLPFILREVKHSIAQLDENQKVTVIIFSGEGVYEVPGDAEPGHENAKGLRKADDAFKEAIDDWLSLNNHNFETGGRAGRHTDKAIKQALSYQPKLIFLLSEVLGGWQDTTQSEIMQNKIIKLIEQANDFDPPAKFNTLHFLYEDPLVRAGLKGTLERIADETGGNYRFISAEELNLK